MSRVVVLQQGQTAELIDAVLVAAREGARGPLLRQLVADAYDALLRRHEREVSAFELFHESYTLALASFRYVPDPGGEELIQPTETTLREGIGDCDDATALVLALAHATSVPARLVLASRYVDGELRAQHMFAEACGPAGCVPCDLGGYRGIGEAPPLANGAVLHYVEVPAGGDGVGFLGSLIGGILGLSASKNQRKAAEAQANATVAAQRLANEGALAVAEENSEAVRTQANALTKAALIEGRVEAERIESRERSFGNVVDLVRELVPVAALVLLAYAVAPAVSKSLRAPAARRTSKTARSSGEGKRRPRKASRRRAAA